MSFKLHRFLLLIIVITAYFTYVHANVSKRGAGTLKRVGYYANWAKYTSCKYMRPSQIDFPHLDYVHYAFAGIDPATFKIRTLEKEDEGLMKELNSAKGRTKTLISIGGWSFSQDAKTSKIFPALASNEKNRRVFAASVVEFVNKHGFDGVDLDWEYPTGKDRQNFVELVKAIRAAGPRLIIAAATPGGGDNFGGYDLGAVSRYVDYFNVMTYDYYGAWDKHGTVNLNSPLDQVRGEKNGVWSTKAAIDYYIAQGVPRHKINIGLALYGRSFTLDNPNNAEPGVATWSKPGKPGRCSKSPGIISYADIAEIVRKGAMPKYTENGHAYYVVYDKNQWIGYDEWSSLLLKIQLAAAYQLNGVMIWSVDQDSLEGGPVAGGFAMPGLVRYISDAATHLCAPAGQLPIGAHGAIIYTSCAGNAVQANQCINGQWKAFGCSGKRLAAGADLRLFETKGKPFNALTALASDQPRIQRHDAFVDYSNLFAASYENDNTISDGYYNPVI
ncbi:uncharacterized protein VTP21DRAFT_11076 [Calcarisporiella thermophila]|uniref:uncharacterized protein n=1 Tax=Calcarisporiella thermophila TaxID=911321 RepID=UPI003742FED3